MSLADQDTACERLMTVPGIGPINSSAEAKLGRGLATAPGTERNAGTTRVRQLSRKFRKSYARRELFLGRPWLCKNARVDVILAV
jgi:hypothetical protein